MVSLEKAHKKINQERLTREVMKSGGGETMREILFRAKRADNGEWAEGYVSEHTICGENTRIETVIEKKPEHIYDCETYVVIPETVGQYTGRLAEDEEKIFEGSKCVLTTFTYDGYDYQHEVVVEECGGGFYFVGEKEDFIMEVAEVEDTESDVEVIGNIHDGCKGGE